MIDDKYFELINTVEKAYIFSLVLFNFKDKYDGKYLKCILKISDIKYDNGYLNYNFYNKCESYDMMNYPYFSNIDIIIDILKQLGDVYINEYNNIELCISSKKLIDDILKRIKYDKLELLIDQDLTDIVNIFNDFELKNQIIKAYLEQFSKIVGTSLQITIYNNKNYELFLELYEVPFTIIKQNIGYIIVYKNSDMLDFLGIVYNYQCMYINHAIYNFNDNDNLPTIKVYKTDEMAILPTKASYSDVGYDLTIIKEHKVLNNNCTLYDTCIKLDIPNGYYVEIVPRSSISKSGYTLSNSVGIIDQSYRGNLLVALTCPVNGLGNNDPLKLPWKCCQLIVKKQVYANLELSVDNLNITRRGEGGFGSTG